jgi:hypothetical protein
MTGRTAGDGMTIRKRVADDTVKRCAGCLQRTGCILEPVVEG